jgi:hypothetical protein
MTPITTGQIVPTATRLRVDAWTSEVVTAIHARRIRTVLLKGPVVVRWLYSEDPRVNAAGWLSAR